MFDEVLDLDTILSLFDDYDEDINNYAEEEEEIRNEILVNIIKYSTSNKKSNKPFLEDLAIRTIEECNKLKEIERTNNSQSLETQKNIVERYSKTWQYLIEFINNFEEEIDFRGFYIDRRDFFEKLHIESLQGYYKELINFKMLSLEKMMEIIPDYSEFMIDFINTYKDEIINKRLLSFSELWSYEPVQAIDSLNELYQKYYGKKLDDKDNYLDVDTINNTSINDDNLLIYIISKSSAYKSIATSKKMIDTLIYARSKFKDIQIPHYMLDLDFKYLNPEQFVRLCCVEDYNVIKFLKSKNERKILEYLITNSGDYITAISKFSENRKQFEELLNDEETISRLENDKDYETAKKICEMILGNQENYFGIYTAEDIDDFEQLRNYEVNRILRGISKPKTKFEKQDGQFAILEGLYGIDIEEAQNLINRFGKYIEQVDISPEDGISANMKKYLIALKNILQLEKNDIVFLSQDREFMKMVNSEKTFSVASITELDKKMREVFERKFEEKMLTEDKLGEPDEVINYKGKQIRVYEIPRKNAEGEYEDINFGIFARVEGSYSGIRFKGAKHFSEKNMNYHGNCESYINQSMTSVARIFFDDDIMFLSNDCKGMTNIAPWDLVSAGNNSSFDPISASNNVYTSSLPTCFCPPDIFANNTRTLHNEVDFERYYLDEETNEVSRRKPKFVGIMKDEIDIDICRLLQENDESLYHNSLQAAADLNLPILIINREALAMLEKRRIDINLERLKKFDLNPNEKEEDFEKLIKDTIVRFEDNIIGSEFCKGKEKYFNDKTRKEMLEQIFDAIKFGNGFDKNRRYLIFQEVLNEEIDRQFDVEGTVVSTDNHFDLYKEISETISNSTPKFGIQKKTKNRITSVKQDVKDIKEILDSEGRY